MPSPTTETNPASTTTTTSFSSASAAATDSTSPATTTSLETDLLTHLASTSALDDIHTNLLCYLQRMGWTEKIRTLSLELLRAGRCERFDEVVDAVIASAECRPHPAFDLSNQDPTTNGSGHGHGHAKGSAKNGSGNANNTGSNGSTGKNGNGSGMGLSADAEAYLENVDVRIPTVVVEHGVRMVKDVLKDVVSWEDGSSLDEGLDQSTGGQATTTSKGAVTGTAGSSSTSGKKLDKDKDKDKDDAGDSSKKNGDVSSSPVKKTAKKSNPGKTGK